MKTLNITKTKISEYCQLIKDNETGIALIEDSSNGLVHSCHPNIDASGSVKGIEQQGYWEKNDRVRQFRNSVYNIDNFVITDELDRLAAKHCGCLSCLGRTFRLRNIDLYRSDLEIIDLTGVNLANADLVNVDFSNLDLRMADLSGANLRGADLQNTNLSHAILFHADLVNADFTNANLRGADLRLALDISKANFDGANLDHAQF